MDAKCRQLSPVPASLDTAKWQTRIGFLGGINKDATCLNSGGERFGGGNILGPNARAKAVARLIRQSDRIFDIASFDECRHGAEGFFIERRHPRPHAGQKRWRIEVSPARQTLAADDQSRTSV